MLSFHGSSILFLFASLASIRAFPLDDLQKAESIINRADPPEKPPPYLDPLDSSSLPANDAWKKQDIPEDNIKTNPPPSWAQALMEADDLHDWIIYLPEKPVPHVYLQGMGTSLQVKQGIKKPRNIIKGIENQSGSSNAYIAILVSQLSEKQMLEVFNGWGPNHPFIRPEYREDGIAVGFRPIDMDMPEGWKEDIPLPDFPSARGAKEIMLIERNPKEPKPKSSTSRLLGMFFPKTTDSRPPASGPSG